jgi:diacylglycerol kinase (ATP)
MTRLVLIANESAGRNRSRPDAIRGLTRDIGAATLEAGDLPSLRQAAREALGMRPEILAVNGGDGTVHGVLTEVMRMDLPLPDLAVIPGGTTNMTANDLNANAPLEFSLRRLGDLSQMPLERRNRVNRPLLKVSGAGDGPQYGFFLGAGVVLDGMDHFRKKVASHGLRGEFAAGLSLLRGLFGMARGDNAWIAGRSAAFSLDGEGVSHDRQFLLVATSLERLLLGMRPWWGDGQGAIHLTSVRRRPKALIRRAPALLSGRRHPRMSMPNGYFSSNVDAFDLYPDRGFALDGEIFPVSDGECVRVEATAPVSFLNLGAQPT